MKLSSLSTSSVPNSHISGTDLFFGLIIKTAPINIKIEDMMAIKEFIFPPMS